MIAMLLAAGRGERLRPMTDEKPKPLIEVAGQSLIERHLLALADFGYRDVVINTAWQGNQIRDALGGGKRFGLRIRYSDEGDSALETGGGVANARELLGEGQVLIVSSDIVTDMPYDAFSLGPGDRALLGLVPNPAHNTRGDFDLHAGRLRNASPAAYTYSGVALLDMTLFEGRSGRFPLVDIFNTAIASGTAAGMVYTGLWADPGTPGRLAAIEGTLGSLSE